MNTQISTEPESTPVQGSMSFIDTSCPTLCEGEWSEPVPGIFHPFDPHFSSLVSPSVDTLEREEIKIVLVIEPATLEEFQRQAGPASEGESIDRELHVGVRFFACIRLVVKDVNVSVADLEEINMASDNVTFEIQIESAAPFAGPQMFEIRGCLRCHDPQIMPRGVEFLFAEFELRRERRNGLLSAF